MGIVQFLFGVGQFLFRFDFAPFIIGKAAIVIPLSGNEAEISFFQCQPDKHHFPFFFIGSGHAAVIFLPTVIQGAAARVQFRFGLIQLSADSVQFGFFTGERFSRIVQRRLIGVQLFFHGVQFRFFFRKGRSFAVQSLLYLIQLGFFTVQRRLFTAEGGVHFGFAHSRIQKFLPFLFQRRIIGLPLGSGGFVLSPSLFQFRGGGFVFLQRSVVCRFALFILSDLIPILAVSRVIPGQTAIIGVFGLLAAVHAVGVRGFTRFKLCL